MEYYAAMKKSGEVLHRYEALSNTVKQTQAKVYTAHMAEIACIFLEYSGKIHEKLVA